MQIGFVSLGMGSAPLAEVLKVGQSSACEAIELNGRQGVHRDLWAPPVDYARLRAEITASDLAITSLGGYSDFAQPTDEGLDAQVAQLVAYCELARAMGIRLVRAFSGDVLEGYTIDTLYPRVVKGFRAVAARIAGWGITIGIENHGRLMNNGDTLRALLTDVDSPIVGITLDTGNFCWAGHSLETAHRFFEQLVPHTANVHVKDGRFENGDWVLYPAGRGSLDLVALFRGLASVAYSGPVLSEYEGQADFRASTLESVAYLRGLRDALH